MTEGSTQIKVAFEKAVSTMNALFEPAWPFEPVLMVEDDPRFTASISRENDLVVRVSTGCGHALERLRQQSAINLDIELALEWLTLHELHHAVLGHFEMLHGVPVLNLLTRAYSEPCRLDTLPREYWSDIELCLELQADHDALEIMLVNLDRSPHKELREIASNITAVMVLIEREGTRNVETSRTHPKSATRIFQLLGHLAEMPLIAAQIHHDTSLIPKEEELQAFARNVTIPCFFDAVRLAQATCAVSTANDLGSSGDFFKDLEIAKLGDPSRYGELKTQGAKEWAKLWPCNEALKPILGGHFTN